MLRVIGYKDLKWVDEDKVINTTSHSNNFGKGLSHFFLGPCNLYDGHVAKNVENSWQFSKCYARFLDKNDNPTEDYFKWAKEGWDKSYAVRYPMGKGMKPAYSWWAGEKLTYVEARKKVYVPLYAEAVQKHLSFAKLKDIYELDVQTLGEDLYLLDFDGYDHKELGMTYDEVINCEKRKMGHAFVLAMLLENYLD